MASPLATRIAVSAAASLLWTTSCVSSSFGPALDQYAAGRYPEALALLRRAEPEQRAWPAGTRLRYALYRGLAELAVGNARSALHWLSTAKRMDALNPEHLAVSDRGRLDAAWHSLGKMPGQTD
jgi:hypothetical protein